MPEALQRVSASSSNPAVQLQQHLQQQQQQQQHLPLAGLGAAGGVLGQVQGFALLVALMCGVALRQLQRAR
jgi:hypothetical protein